MGKKSGKRTQQKMRKKVMSAEKGRGEKKKKVGCALNRIDHLSLAHQFLGIVLRWGTLQRGSHHGTGTRYPRVLRRDEVRVHCSTCEDKLFAQTKFKLASFSQGFIAPQFRKNNAKCLYPFFVVAAVKVEKKYSSRKNPAKLQST